MIPLDALEQAFASIEQLGKKEETFPVNGVPVTVRPLQDDENIRVWQYAGVAFEKGDDAGAQQDWMHRMKVATLAYAIVQMGDLDLRSPEVDTGERLSNGTPIKREKFEVVRGMLAKWSSPLLLRVYARYGDFHARMDIAAEKAVDLDPVDFDAEISRHREIIEDLEKRREQAEQNRIDPIGQRVKSAVALTQHQRAQNLDLTKHVQHELASQPAPVQEPPQYQDPAREQHFLHPDILQEYDEEYDSEPEYQVPPPRQAPPPRQSPRQAPSPPQPPPGYDPEAVRQHLARNSQHSNIDPDSSFIDPYDEDAIAEMNRRQAEAYAQRQDPTYQEEQQRVQRMRQQALDNRRQAESGAGAPKSRYQSSSPVPVTGGRKPPHLQAAEVESQLGHRGPVAVFRGAGPEGEDVPAYRLEPQVLSSRGQNLPDNSPRRTGAKRKNNKKDEPVVNSAGQGRSNPKFKPPRGR